MPRRIVVFGASGFVGSAITAELRRASQHVIAVRAPRLRNVGPEHIADLSPEVRAVLDRLEKSIYGADVVINAAGNPDASLRDADVLIPPNAVLPGLIAVAVGHMGVPRFVHVSSAVVQGRRECLDESKSYDAFSPYALSKILGEQLVLKEAPIQSVVYRPPSVHAPDRRVTRMTTRIAQSRFASVAAPGSAPSPQALLLNVASAVAYLATTDSNPPSIVIHPWEGITTEGLMQLLGGRPPVTLPRGLASVITAGLRLFGRIEPRLSANARRVEMLWFGQAQAGSWLTDVGWYPPVGASGWAALRTQLCETP